jgi:hypothetical protein
MMTSRLAARAGARSAQAPPEDSGRAGEGGSHARR